MIVQGRLEKPSKFEGKQYWYDFDTDAMYIELRHANSEYSDMKDIGERFFVIDYDRDGNVIGVTMESVFAQASKRELSLRLKIALLLFRMRLIPAQVIAKLITTNLKKLAEKMPAFDSNSGLKPIRV